MSIFSLQCLNHLEVNKCFNLLEGLQINKQIYRVVNEIFNFISFYFGIVFINDSVKKFSTTDINHIVYYIFFKNLFVCKFF